MDAQQVIADDHRHGSWTDLGIAAADFRASASLETGQCFHWKRLGPDDWLGVIDDNCVMLRSTSDTTLAKALYGKLDVPGLRAYLNIGADKPILSCMLDEWDEMARDAALALPGARVLQQKPEEALISFICSANNNVPRITLILDRIRARCGNLLGELPEDFGQKMVKEYDIEAQRVPTHVRDFVAQRRLCAFPRLQALADLGEDELKDLGLGYRAKYVKATAKLVAGGGAPRQLRLAGRERAERELCRLPGVGPKVAACVALYSLGFHDAVPVDVHVARVAQRFAPPPLAKRLNGSATPRIQKDVASLFRDRFGQHAGWAQHVIFAAERAGRLFR
eukprot:Skav232477  [mRNA]  locus=scaffold2877:190502:191509:+ [translate_table: standard]